MRDKKQTIIREFKPLMFLVTLLCALVLLTGYLKTIYASSSTIIINEVLYDPIDTDLGYEWIELYNKSTDSVDINNWKIQSAGTTFKDVITIVNTQYPTVIAPETYFTICEKQVTGCSYYVDKLAFQNGGSESDGIRIQDSKGYTVDTLIYDSPNSSELVDDSGLIATQDHLALVAESGYSLGRKNFIDTDDNSQDFYIFTKPTPQAPNPLSEELGNTGSNILYLIIPLLVFILFSYSGTLLNRLNLEIIKNGKIYVRKEEHKSYKKEI